MAKGTSTKSARSQQSQPQPPQAEPHPPALVTDDDEIEEIEADVPQQRQQAITFVGGFGAFPPVDAINLDDDDDQDDDDQDDDDVNVHMEPIGEDDEDEDDEEDDEEDPLAIAVEQVAQLLITEKGEAIADVLAGIRDSINQVSRVLYNRKK